MSAPDGVNDTLKERINQLENELKFANERLNNTLDQNEEMRKDMDSLRMEAHDIVSQWEKAASGSRKKYEASLLNIEKLERTVQTKEAQIAALEEKQKSSDCVLQEYSESLDELMKENENFRSCIKDLEKRLTSTETSFAESSTRIKEYEGLTFQLQEQLRQSFEDKKKQANEIEELRVKLANASLEIDRLNADCAEISNQADQLLVRTEELKKANESLKADRDTAQNNYSDALKEARAEIERLGNNLSSLDDEYARLKSEEENAQAILSQQLEIISGLENDLAEKCDSETTLKKAMDEIVAENETLKQDYAELSNMKEEALIELTALKECYASVLVEFSEYKTVSESSLSNLKTEFESSLSAAKQNLILEEHKYAVTMDALRQLTESLRAAELRELTHLEDQQRGEITVEYFMNLTPLLHVRLGDVVTRATGAEASVNALNEKLLHTQEELKTVSERLQAEVKECTRLREGLAAEENKVQQYTAELNDAQSKLQSTEVEKQALSQDNDWLKDQVEGMRRELGELDEILNANLNEIREENEKYALDNEMLRKKVNSFVEKEEEFKTKLSLQEKHVQDLEAELAAQERTLAITEADLADAKQTLENHEASVKHLTVKLELAEEEARKASAARDTISAKYRTIQEQLKNQEAKLNLIVSDKRHELDAMRLKVNEHVERTELLEKQIASEMRRREEAEDAVASMKEGHGKMRGAMEEMRERCSKDASTIKELVSERDDLLKDRDIIVEKYNKLHDAFCALRREAGSRSSDDFKKLFDLSLSQESELQKLRHQNEILKKSVSMFVTTVQQKPENLFVERLNLTEGPLRHPKKRSLQQPNE